MTDAELIVVSTPEATIAKITGELRLRIEHIEQRLDVVTLSHPKVVVLDLSGLTFMSSLAMGIFLTLNRTVQKHGGQLRIAGLQPLVETTLHFTRLTELIKAYPTVEAAIKGE